MVSRRRMLGIGAALAASISPWARAGATTAAGPPPGPRAPATLTQAADALRPVIRPRADWAGADKPVTGELFPEEDVRFLLVHHTASTNAYEPDGVIDQIRGFYDFHTGPEKGWADVAYNFFIDKFGTIWEGRDGSIAGPVRGDATGGSQGFALLCSLIGNYAEEPVTSAQQASLGRLLAWLGESYAIDTTPGATTTFTSRGSNKWPAGTDVTARTISGHRDMSTTSCPGDFAYDLLDLDLPTQVSELRLAVAGGTPTTTTTAAGAEQATDGGGSTAGTQQATGADPTGDDALQNPSATIDGDANSSGGDGGGVMDTVITWGPLSLLGGLAYLFGKALRAGKGPAE